MKVSAENAIRGYVVFPSLTEQAEIGALFAKIDSLIALHQRERVESRLQVKTTCSKINLLNRLSARMRTLNAGIGAPSMAEKYSRARVASTLSINLSKRPNSLRLSSSTAAVSS